MQISHATHVRELTIDGEFDSSRTSLSHIDSNKNVKGQKIVIYLFLSLIKYQKCSLINQSYHFPLITHLLES